MNTPARHLVCLSLFALSSVACATADEETPQSVADDTGTVDTAPATTPDSTPGDSAVVDSSPSTVTDVGTDAARCVYPVTETKACGACGTQSRFCLPEGVWTGFTECTGERGDAECKVGEKRVAECGNCGKATDFCDIKNCTWITGICAGEGACAPGDTEATTASCTLDGDVRTRACGTTCQWGSFSECRQATGWLPMETAPLTGRNYHSAVWTGDKMLVWGGYGATPTYKADGAFYHRASDTWKLIPSAPGALAGGRRSAAVVWTGSKVIVFGGRDANVQKDGAIYDPESGNWTTIAASPLAARQQMAAAWSPATNEMIVWGGCTSSGTTCTSFAADGAAYNPTTDEWTMLPAAPIGGRGDPVYAWSGTELIILGGKNNTSAGVLGGGARFDPVARSWVKFTDPVSSVYDPRFDVASAWNGTSLFMHGGRTGTTASTAKKNGAIYTPSVGWSAIPDAPDTIFPPGGARFDHAAFFGAGKLFVFSGLGTGSTTASVGGMAAYDPSTESWTNVDSTGAPTVRARASVVWTGTEAIVWGGGLGDSTTANFNNGGIYRPTSAP